MILRRTLIALVVLAASAYLYATEPTEAQEPAPAQCPAGTRQGESAVYGGYECVCPLGYPAVGNVNGDGTYSDLGNRCPGVAEAPTLPGCPEAPCPDGYGTEPDATGEPDDGEDADHEQPAYPITPDGGPVVADPGFTG